MTQGQIIAVVIAGVIVFDFLILKFVIVAAVRNTFAPLAERYPPSEPAPGALVRRYQSFKFGLLNMGWSVHVAADAGHLHLTPTRFMRLFGARAVSLPWDAIQPGRRGFGKSRYARVGMTEFLAPAWCIDLAEPGERGAERDPKPGR